MVRTKVFLTDSRGVLQASWKKLPPTPLTPPLTDGAKTQKQDPPKFEPPPPQGAKRWDGDLQIVAKTPD